jgi:ferritin-like metal-binding protein YciE
MKLRTLEDVLHHELRDLYSAEKQITQALPKMAEAATDAKLKAAFKDHLEMTKTHLERLEQLGRQLGVTLTGETCEGMKGLIKEGEELIEDAPAGEARDAALIAAAQRVEHYEMAGYGCARTYARTLGHGEAADLLQTTLDEEGATDEKLTKLAESRINEEAMAR